MLPRLQLFVIMLIRIFWVTFHNEVWNVISPNHILTNVQSLHFCMKCVTRIDLLSVAFDSTSVWIELRKRHQHPMIRYSPYKHHHCCVWSNPPGSLQKNVDRLLILRILVKMLKDTFSSHEVVVNCLQRLFYFCTSIETITWSRKLSIIHPWKFSFCSCFKLLKIQALQSLKKKLLIKIKGSNRSQTSVPSTKTCTWRAVSSSLPQITNF